MLADIQILDADDNYDGATGDTAIADPTDYRRYRYSEDSDGEYLWKDPSLEPHSNLDYSDAGYVPTEGGPATRTPGSGLITPYKSRAEDPISGDLAELPQQTDSPKDGGGKKVSNFISEDTKVMEDGSVQGTMHKVDSVSSFPGVSNGYFFPIKLGQGYSGKNITVTGVNGPRTAQDLEWLIQIKDANTKVTFECDGKVFLTLTFKNVTFE